MLVEKLCLEHSVILKIANTNDLPTIFALVDCYNDGMIIDKTIAKNSIRDLVYIEGALLVEYEGSIIGGIGGYVSSCMFTKDIMFSIMFFYILPEYRFLTTKIIKELELVMLPTKATRIVFGVPIDGAKHPKSLIKYFIRQGYKPLETHLFKRISNAKT